MGQCFLRSIQCRGSSNQGVVVADRGATRGLATLIQLPALSLSPLCLVCLNLSRFVPSLFEQACWWQSSGQQKCCCHKRVIISVNHNKTVDVQRYNLSELQSSEVWITSPRGQLQLILIFVWCIAMYFELKIPFNFS